MSNGITGYLPLPFGVKVVFSVLLFDFESELLS